MRECRKCGEKIPYKVKIDGKQKSLQNRKFCLKCSPYKRHNTSPNDPIKRRKKGRYREYTSETKEGIILSLYKRALTRKSELIAAAGGGCIKCGYNKCTRALTFHHKDPTKKNFCLGLPNLWSKSANAIKAEAKKCELLCMNCHAEVETNLSKTKHGYVAKVNKKYGTNFNN